MVEQKFEDWSSQVNNARSLIKEELEPRLNTISPQTLKSVNMNIHIHSLTFHGNATVRDKLK